MSVAVQYSLSRLIKKKGVEPFNSVSGRTGRGLMEMIGTSMYHGFLGKKMIPTISKNR